MWGASGAAGSLAAAFSQPVIGWTVGAGAAAILGGASTYAVGHLMRRHFEGGGTMEDFKAENTKEAFKELIEKGKTAAKSIRGRGKAGGVRVVDSLDEVKKAAESLIGRVRQEGIAAPHVVTLILEAIDRVRVILAGIQAEGVEPDGEMFDAKVKVLSEYVKHHVKEEQNEMFPKAKSSSLDMDDLGAQMAARKDELLAQAA